jgi:hypothetical protein
MPSQALAVFERLCEQVDELRAAAALLHEDGLPAVAASMWRACIVLTIAALDTYMHERGVELLCAYAQSGHANAATVSNYLQSMSAAEATGPNAPGLVRLRLSYKTLVAPPSVDALLKAAGYDDTAVWLSTAISAGSRPDRLRALTQVQYDRRNQIAHEGDWDHAAFDVRRVSDDHVADCVDHVRMLVTNMDSQL